MNVSSRVNQHLGDLDIAAGRCADQRRAATLVGVIGVCLRFAAPVER
jgi:hypothetical protein